MESILCLSVQGKNAQEGDERKEDVNEPPKKKKQKKKTEEENPLCNPKLQPSLISWLGRGKEKGIYFYCD